MRKGLEKSLMYLLLIFIMVLNSSFVYAQVPPVPTALNKETTAKIKLQAILTPPYIIGPGDQLVVTDRTLREVAGQLEQYNVTVSPDGSISIPLPDGTQENIPAAGLTLEELSKEVRESFGKTLKNPLVFVQILRYRPINVYIGGEVVKPGVYKIETTTTSEKGGSTTSSLNTFGLSLTEAIQLAGGLRPRANVTSITVTRGSNSEKKIINLLRLLKGEDTSQDISLQPGDAIYIPIAENEEEQAQSHVTLLGKIAYQEVPVSIVGEAKNTGNFVLPNDATLLDAIGRAGGTNDVGTLKKIRLSRYDSNGVYRTYKINVHDLIHRGISFDQIALRPNDTIELEASKGKEVRHFLRESGISLLPIVTGTVTGTFGGFLVQDSFIDRLARISRSGSLLPTGGGGSSAITIIGGSK